VLVNNAGGVTGQEMHSIEEVPDADWDRIFAVNIGAAFVLSRAVAAGERLDDTIHLAAGNHDGWRQSPMRKRSLPLTPQVVHTEKSLSFR
jgi:NAD(P)-dependent dehydrogenase (short-subunit alcohol dehydrogenase family)